MFNAAHEAKLRWSTRELRDTDAGCAKTWQIAFVEGVEYGAGKASAKCRRLRKLAVELIEIEDQLARTQDAQTAILRSEIITQIRKEIASGTETENPGVPEDL